MIFIKKIKKIIKNFIYYTPEPVINRNFNLLDGKITEGVRLNIAKLGNKNSKKIFYVIKRTHGAGLFSNLSFVLNHLIIAKQFNFEPVIDMDNFVTWYNEKPRIMNTRNAWEYYFENISKIKLEEVYKSQCVIFTDNIYHKNFYRDDYYKSPKIKYIFDKYIKIKKFYYDEANTFIKKNFGKSKVLGVYLRGGEFLKIANHHFPATLEQAIAKVKIILNNEDYGKIFLSTKEEKYQKEFTKIFGEKLISFPSFKSNQDSMKIYPRPLHRYKMGKEILIETIILSKLAGFFYSYTNVSQTSMLLNLNRNQKRYFVNNGKNHKNVFIAKLLWFLRSNLPENLGGFKNIK